MALERGSAGDDDRVRRSVTVDLVEYDPEYGLGTWWDDDTVLRVEVVEHPERTAVISANPAGLRSLARHLLTLAQDKVPGGRHFDFDRYCGWLDDGSVALRIEVEK